MAMRHHAATMRHAFEEHTRLTELLERIQHTLASPQADPAHVAEMFQELGAQLLAHFDQEEHGGYFTEVTERAPHLRSRASALEQEHADLAARLVALKQAAAMKNAEALGWQRLQQEFAGFFESFRVHEAAENKLLQEAYNDEIGVKD